MKFKLTFRIWLLLIFIIASLLSIFVSSSGILFLQDGVLVNSVDQNSQVFELGLRQGQTILQINGDKIKNLEDYTQKINQIFENTNESKITIQTKELEIIGLFTSNIKQDIVVEEIPNTRIQTGLDIRGGARALVTAENQELTQQEVQDLILVSQQRLNLYGLSDVSLFSVEIDNQYFMRVLIAGSTPEDLEELVLTQGKFEAKIGNTTVFRGGDKDITHVGGAAEGALVYDCQERQGQSICMFRFPITLSPEAAERYAQTTKDIPINKTNPGYLEQTIDFYLDDQLTDSLLISRELKGSDTSQHSIQGSGTGETRQDALDNAEQEMKKLQTILKTGSLPYKLEVVESTRISPKLGQGFARTLLIGGLSAVLAVSILIFIRYRRPKISVAIILVSFSEVLIILGIASLIKWNLDLPSIAGIIAAIGTGIDSQIIILDESKHGEESLKQKIKKALFIIASTYFTTLLALLPLSGALSFLGIEAVSGGLLTGFAVTTSIGISAGVFITRPAFADIARQLEDDS